MRTFRVDKHGVGAMIEMPDHAPLIQRQVQLISLLPKVALHRVESVGFELGCGAEEMGVVGHVKHAMVPHRPCALLFQTGAVDEDGVAFVDAAGDVGVAAGAEDGGGAGVGVDAGEVGGGKGEAAIRIVDGGGVVEEEGAVGLGEEALLAAEDEGAEFEAGVDIREEGRKVCSETTVFEVEEAADAAAGGDGFEEAGGGLVGVDAGGGEQADNAVGFGQAHGALDEEGVEVDVAAAEQGVVGGSADELAEAVGAQFGGVEIGGEGVALVAQLLDAAAAGGGGGGEGEIRRAGGKPFDLLELDAVPGRVADDGVEAAGGLVVLPAVPDAGEGDFPVEEGFAGGDGPGGVPHVPEFLPVTVFALGRSRVECVRSARK